MSEATKASQVLQQAFSGKAIELSTLDVLQFSRIGNAQVTATTEE